MRRAREKGKVAFETYKEPDTQETKDLKKALSSKIPTEIDYYLEDADHEEGTNKYTFKFPPEWRTLANADLVFGVRGIYVNNDEKLVHGWIIICVDSVEVIVADINTYYSSYHRLNNFLIAIKAQMKNKVYRYNLNHTDKPIDYKFKEINSESYVSGRINYELKSLKSYVKFKIDGNSEFKSMFMLNDYNSKKMYDSIVFSGIERKEKYLIQASFVNTKHQHLGFTGIQYQPIKYYKIDNNTNEFHIGIFSEDGSKMIEFPKNKIDHLVIETLILQDSNYMLTI